MSSLTPGVPPSAFLRTIRMIAAAFLGSVVLVAFAMSFVVESDQWFEVPGVLGLALPVVVGALALGGILTVGHQVPAIAPGTPADQAKDEARQRFQASMFIRLAFAEIPLLAGIAATFVSETPSLIPVLIGAVIAVVLHLAFAFPHAASVRRVERGLDRDGGRSRLAEALGLGAGPGAPGYAGDGTVI